MSCDSAFSSFDHVAPGDGSLKVEPSSPAPLPAASVIVFGSQGSDFLNGFDSILGLSRHHPELAAFLSMALAAVRAELQSVANRHHDVSAPTEPISTLQQQQQQSQIELLACLPPFEPFSDLKTLVDFHRRNKLKDPVINGVLLCLLQTASVVAVYCVAHQDGSGQETSATSVHLKQAWKALSEPCSHLLGYCTGALSAFSLRQLSKDHAASTLPDIWAYANDAIKAIRICFWVSLHSASGGRRLARGEEPVAGSDHWSFVVSVKEADYMEKVYLRLARFNELAQQRPLDEPVPLVVTAKALDQVSIGGPPQQLERFKAYLVAHLGPKCRVLPLKLFSPYHTVDLQHEAEFVMRDLEHRGLIDDSLLTSNQKIIWETTNANILCESTLRGAVRVIVASNLATTADWDAMVDRMMLLEGERHLAKQYASRAVVSFSPGTSLAADLSVRLSTLHEALPSTGSVTHIDVSSLLHDHVVHLDQAGVRASLLPEPDIDGEEVVIVSMACRFPGDVRNPEQLWTCLETGRSTVSEIPKHLFDINAYFGEGVNQTMAKHMHALPENVVKSMDARLFSMSPKEIEQLDPQHRLVMLCSYEALERAGYSAEANSPSSFDGKRIAVCMAASWDDYRENASWNIGSYFITGNIRAFIPGHVSFSLKWEGPSVSVDTLECSAVSAIQWSRQALLSGQCDVALAGAVNVLTQPQMFIAMDKQGILSRSGTNATFSSKLDGKTRGDGCGVLLLKRRSTALRDGDKILATLPAARTTYHGHAHEGEEASAGQSQFLARVVSEAGARASDVVHIEASGFHTQRGEAAEFDSFRRLLVQSNSIFASTSQDQISVASSRPNIGAGEAVSAMASVMKAVLMFEKASVPRQISTSDPSELQPSIAATCTSSALYVPTQAHRLPNAEDRQGRRIILVNSLASTNCHGVVLVGSPTADEPLPSYHQPASNVPFSRAETAWPFMLSAKTKESAEMLKKSLVDYLQREVDLVDLSYTLACRRTHHPFRLSVVASEKDELVRRLRGAEFIEAKQVADLPPLGFIFGRAPPASPDSMEALYRLAPSLQDRLHELSSSTSFPESFDDAELRLQMMQTCLALLFIDCGIRPSMLGTDADLDHFPQCVLDGLMEFNQFWRTTDKEEAEPSRYTLVKLDSSVSLTAGTFEDGPEVKTTPAGPTADPHAFQRSLLSCLGSLHQQGYRIHWVELFRSHLATVRFVESLPTYPFHLQQHWMEYHDRNLLPHTVVDREGSREAKTSSDNRLSETRQESNSVEAYEPTSQPLLTEQVGAGARSRTYRSELFDEALVALLKAALPGAVIMELFVEAIREASMWIDGWHFLLDQRVLCLHELNLDKMASALSELFEVSISVVSEQPTTKYQNNGSVTVVSQDAAHLGSCAWEWVDPSGLRKRWSKLQNILPDRIARIENDGERLSSNFVHKIIHKHFHGDLKSDAESIRSAFLDSQSCEAVVRMGFPSTDLECLTGSHEVLPRLLSSLEQCAVWYVCERSGLRNGEVGMCSVEDVCICGEWLDSLVRQMAVCYTVYMSSPFKGDCTRKPIPDEPEVELDMMILDDKLNIVGELTCFRLTRYGSDTEKKVSISAANPPSARVSKAVASSIPQNGPQQAVSPPSVPVKLPPTRQAGRAGEVNAKVLGVLASELGIAVEEMKPTVKFADLGLDSLMSLVCISTLETLGLGFDIPQSLFMECDSPAELLAWIRAQVGDDAAGGEVEPTAAPVQGYIGDPSDVEMSPPSSSTTAESVQAHSAPQAPASSSAAEAAIKTIRHTIETELGVAEGSIDPDANLADLGMDSLMSLLVLGNLSGMLPIELPSSLFMDCASLREIDTFVASQLGGSSAPAPSAAVAAGQDIDAKPPSKAVEFAIPPAKKPVLLRKGSSSSEGDTPLFLLPDGSGMSTVYQHFHAIDRPIYSINSPFLADASAWNGGVTQIARYYLESMKLVQPSGPWLVGGWSFGGMVAFEIARLLATSTGAATDRIAGLFLIDSPCPVTYPPLPMSIVEWIFTAPEVKDIAPPALSSKLIAHFKATVDSLVGWRPASIGSNVPKTWYIVADQPLPGKMEDVEEVNDTVRMLFSANRAEERGPDGWQQLLPSDKIEVRRVAEANHFTLVREPVVASIAAILQEACSKALQG
ncbi:related to Polyketide synthase [Sporisorium reilianum f. sp. reilianum]|uniref:Related to Polyketide synthase n=1 Tax=Sporisorium reilianum f. sp. reilianum TaxID=72559 RepID=A0A2N8UP53_9BASI|nr:related to Polyketide synthase [Sporisorium reilianum f. sp. reilianum]